MKVSVSLEQKSLLVLFLRGWCSLEQFPLSAPTISYHVATPATELALRQDWARLNSDWKAAVKRPELSRQLAQAYSLMA